MLRHNVPYLYIIACACTLEHVIMSCQTNMIIIASTDSPEHIKIHFLIHLLLRRKAPRQEQYIYSRPSGSTWLEMPAKHLFNNCCLTSPNRHLDDDKWINEEAILFSRSGPIRGGYEFIRLYARLSILSGYLCQMSHFVLHRRYLICSSEEIMTRKSHHEDHFHIFF